MNLILTVLEVTAPVFALAMVGYVWTRAGFDYPVAFVTRLVMTLSTPALIFVALMKTEVSPEALATISLAALVAYGAITVALWVTVALIGLHRPTFLAPLISGNTGNLGLPLAFFAFGAEGLGYAVVIFAVTVVMQFTFGLWMVAGRGNAGRILREPLIWGAILGGLFLWQGWETPRVMTNTLELLGQMTIPLMLITLGVAIARLRPASLGRAAWLSALKFGLCSTIAWGIGLLFALPPVAFAVIVVQLSAPVAVTSYLLAEKYKDGSGADPDAVAGLVVVSTLMSVITLPLILALVM